jgi:nucleoside-diphosphate-sugar epimerase
MNWRNLNVLVTGGAGFIGSNLVNSLLELGADVTIVDKLIVPGAENRIWEERLNHLSRIFSRHGFSQTPIHVLDLSLERERFYHLAEKSDIVFHMGAVHGGRPFVDNYQSETAKNFAIDYNVISSASEAGVKHLAFASSACVYPPKLQDNQYYLLREEDALSIGDGWKSSDNVYGWAKLMAEYMLASFNKEKNLKSSICRFLTVYGPGCFDESHAIPALIGKANRKEDPYVVFGTGNQERGFTYVDDIVDGFLMAAEKIQDATPVNLGWDKRYKIKDVVSMILQLAKHKPAKIIFDTTKPEGPFSRALDVSRAKKIMGWNPKIDLKDGLLKTIEWTQKKKIVK